MPRIRKKNGPFPSKAYARGFIDGIVVMKRSLKPELRDQLHIPVVVGEPYADDSNEHWYVDTETEAPS